MAGAKGLSDWPGMLARKNSGGVRALTVTVSSCEQPSKTIRFSFFTPEPMLTLLSEAQFWKAWLSMR